MSELLNKWAVTRGYDKGAKVELYKHSDGSEHYTGRTKTGFAYSISNKAEAEKIIKNFRMERII